MEKVVCYNGEKENKVNNVKKIFFGTLIENPAEGKTLTLELMGSGKIIKTSEVEKFVVYYERVWIVETQNSIYVLQAQEDSE